MRCHSKLCHSLPRLSIQFPVCLGAILVKQAESTVTLNDIHNFLMRFILLPFFDDLQILSEPPICPRNIKLIRYGLRRLMIGQMYAQVRVAQWRKVPHILREASKQATEP